MPTAVKPSVASVVDAFNAAWSRHDLSAALALTAPDAVFEATSPAPDGTRYVGRTAIRAAWEAIFDDAESHFTVEDRLVTAETVVQRWRYDWRGGHVRGIDLIVVHDGLITEKIAYVKG